MNKTSLDEFNLEMDKLSENIKKINQLSEIVNFFNKIINLQSKSNKILEDLKVEKIGYSSKQIANLKSEIKELSKTLNILHHKIENIENINDIKCLNEANKKIEEINKIETIEKVNLRDCLCNYESFLINKFVTNIYNKSNKMVLQSYLEEIDRLKNKKIGLFAYINGKRKLNTKQIECLEKKCEYIKIYGLKNDKIDIEKDVLRKIYELKFLINKIEETDFFEKNFKETSEFFNKVIDNYNEINKIETIEKIHLKEANENEEEKFVMKYRQEDINDKILFYNKIINKDNEEIKTLKNKENIKEIKIPENGYVNLFIHLSKINEKLNNKHEKKEEKKNLETEHEKYE